MNCLTSFAKYTLFFFNFLIVICGITFVAIGAIIIANENKGIDSFTDFSVGGFAIGVGLIIFFIAFFGCWGAIKENSCLLTTYAAILIVLLILQLVLGALAFVAIQDEDELKTKVRSIAQHVFDNFMENQNTNEIDIIQKDFECCGVSGSSYYTEEHSTPPPKSCYDDNGNLFQTGCATAFKDFISLHIKVIGGVAVAFGVVELLGAIFAFVVRNKIPEY